jgi:putative membrane protein
VNWLSLLPTVNASLNALSGVFLLLGYVNIRRGERTTHKRFMLAACATSILFLATYLTYHALAGSTRFAGTGWSRPVYFAILLSHTILAAAIVPMAIITLSNALRNRLVQHRRIARWTFPIWMYVSVTGVLVYLFLYHLFPAA